MTAASKPSFAMAESIIPFWYRRKYDPLDSEKTMQKSGCGETMSLALRPSTASPTECTPSSNAPQPAKRPSLPSSCNARSIDQGPGSPTAATMPPSLGATVAAAPAAVAVARAMPPTAWLAATAAGQEPAAVAAAAALEARIDKSLDEISRDDRKAWGRRLQWQLWGGAGKVLGRGRGAGATGVGRAGVAGGALGVRKMIRKTKVKGSGKGKAMRKGGGKLWNSWQAADAQSIRLGRGRGRGRGLGRSRGKGLGRGRVRRTIGGKARGKGKGKGRGLGYVNGSAVRRKGLGRGGVMALTNGSIEAYSKRSTEASEKRSIFFSGADFGTPSSVLMQHFEQAGDVSKFSLYTLPDGRSRGMGYCEFTKVHMAQEAIYGLSGAYVEGRLLQVSAYEPAA
mmetsp:Transcript_45711/g.116196  ORF Transcript_45711/g.116196 Transcript_45711/m.116196 type:complete len:396 (+) Transcript_45711:167-1354(+)